MHLSISIRKAKPILACLLLTLAINLSAQIDASDWTLASHAHNEDAISEVLSASLDINQLYHRQASSTAVEMWLPDPTGTLSLYQLIPTTTVHPSVAQHYEVKTYRGYNLDQPSQKISCTLSPQGLVAFVLAGNKSFVIEPDYTSDNHRIYYNKSVTSTKHSCHVDALEDANKSTSQKQLIPDAKKTYRLALVAAGEYSIQFGGNPVDPTLVLNAMAAGVNQLNLIYLRDLGIEFSLVSTPALVFSDPNTDPFTTSVPDGLAAENENVLENSLTPAGYDVGHALFWANLGGDSQINVVCRDGFKGAGYSSSDVSQVQLWIDQAAHHLGHQFGASHTHSSRECTNANQGNTYEPGEGSSIMANAGKCDTLAQYAATADPFFHYASIEEIFTARQIDANSGGNNCAVIDPTGNPDDPMVDAGRDLNIPISTPFVLVGTARDSDTDLTYNWSQYDGDGNGTIGSPSCMDEVALFRFRPPVPENFRFFPDYAEVLSGNNNGAMWEVLPCSPRSMNFSLAVRDNNPAWGRVTQDTTRVHVLATGPFAVTFPNGGEMLNGGQAETITWDENGTSAHCPLVDIHLSTDSGVTFTVIADAVSNTGMATLILPNMTEGNARILITCDAPGGFGSASTFYDLSDGDFEINQTMTIDNDGDGFDSTVDCDDNNDEIFPGANEICNGLDDNCSGLIDDSDPLVIGLTTFYADADGDGFGDMDAFVDACAAPTGFVTDFTDCNDTDPAINPMAQEICNGIDDDCDGLVDSADPDLVGTAIWYADVDGDSYGDPNNSTMSCTQPAGFVNNDGDCDDTDPAINPMAQEICNGLDDDCDGLVDAADPGLVGTAIWYADVDGDNFGDPNNSTMSCTQPAGFVNNNEDCDDTNSTINPAAQEICNGIDDDCDGLIDSADPSLSGSGTSTWFEDNDGDGFGNPFATLSSCSQPVGYVSNGNDCNDNNNNVNPTAQEVCNGIDDDCDGLVDAADPSVIGGGTWYADNDGDGFGNPFIPFVSCAQPVGFVDNDLDCDDSFSSIFPGAPELCNGVDDDCDGLIDAADPDLMGATLTWYGDFDGDGFGNIGNSIQACTQPIGFVSNSGDCNDNNANINPTASEVCNGIDDDCDGLTDDNDPSLVGGTTYYRDNDLDGFGDPNVTILSCMPPIGYVANNSDCNDNDININPTAIEICNGLDDDCDGLIDDNDPGVSGLSTWYLDADGDGFGTISNSLVSCSQPNGYVSNDIDCDDNNTAINAAAQEICNGIDDDCDGLIDAADPDVQGGSIWFQDLDGDGFGSPLTSQMSCSQPTGFVPNDLDCNDNNPNVNPAAAEICNGIDDDCDGLIDDNDPDATGASIWYADFDGDLFGSSTTILTSCTQPIGYVANNLDCNDNNANVNPGAGEICDNNIDDDCDGLIDGADPDVAGGSTTWFQDLDSDGFGDANSSLSGCNQPAGFVGNDLDCNDNNPNVNPATLEVCDNGIDDDCDGLIDTSDPDVANIVLTWYFDMDGDTYGGTQTLMACTQPAGYVLLSGDCDDTDPAVSPLAQEVCDNGIDDDCDGLIDTADPDVVILTWYQDQDQDGFGDLSVALTSCSQPVGFVSNGIDCNDQDASINPNALELCDNGIDDDCDGLIDSADPDETGDIFWYEDLDGDGFGNPQVFSLSCSPPAGFVRDNTDCNDNAASINPAALELCDNGIDDDCDGLIDSADPDVAAIGTWYLDNDGDGFGDANNSIQTCNPSSNYVNNSNDCDDNNASINPNGIEVCNGLDDNCNGLVDIDDPALSGVGIWFADEDGDGYGDPDNFIFECSQLQGFLPNNEDCDDTNPDINPEAVEVCNGIDDNCDGLVDDSDPSVLITEWYLDADGDGFGDPETALTECFQPLGFVDNDLDCDDLNPEVNPAQQEIPDNDIDENCDGQLTSLISIAESVYSIYPNPVRETLYVEGNRGQEIEVQVLDIQGKVIKKALHTLPAKLSLEGMQGGTYLILLQDPETGQRAVDKLIKLN
jgi:hypothetical protein